MFKSLGVTGNSMFHQYNENEWRMNNRMLYDLADEDCSKNEALGLESRRMCKDFSGRAEDKLQDVERQFQLRIQDIEFWRKELDNQVAALLHCNDLLTRLKTRLKTAWESCEEPIKICREVIIKRDARQAAELVNDEAENQVQKYLALLSDAMAVLQRAFDEADEQERANRAVIHHLRRDMEDKFTAITIDYSALCKCREIMKPDCVRFDEEHLRPKKGTVTLADWESWTVHNVKKAEHERNITDKLRPLLEQILRQTYEDLELQRRKTINALKDRIKRVMEAQKQIEDRLARVTDQISRIKVTLDNLEMFLDENLKYLDLARKRIEERRYRPRMELVNDKVSDELLKEVAQLVDIIAQLKEKIRENQDMMRQLEQTELALKKQAELKKDAIFIDENCVNQLSKISHTSY